MKMGSDRLPTRPKSLRWLSTGLQNVTIIIKIKIKIMKSKADSPALMLSRWIACAAMLGTGAARGWVRRQNWRHFLALALKRLRFSSSSRLRSIGPGAAHAQTEKLESDLKGDIWNIGGQTSLQFGC